MTVTQRTADLRPEIRDAGCLFLCYLWSGWLFNAVCRSGLLPSVTSEMVNECYYRCLRGGSIDEWCRVHQPIDVVGSFPAMYGDVPSINVDRAAPVVRVCSPFLCKAPQQDQFTVSVARWKTGHWTAVCHNPHAYYDPIVASVIRAGVVDRVQCVRIRWSALA